MFSDLHPFFRPRGLLFWGGSGGSGVAEEAGQIQSQGALNAADTQEKYLQNATTQIQPWQRAGSAAVGQIGGLLGLPGYTALDPTATLKATPGYQFLLDQGADAMGRYGSATGLSLSGAAAKGITNYGQNLAQTYAWGPYMSNLQNLSGQGLGAGSQIGGWNMAAGSNIGNYQMAAADAKARALIQEANMKNQSQSDLLGGLGFLGGTIGGSILGMPGVGGAIGKTIGGAIDNWGYQGSSPVNANMGNVSSDIPMSFFADGGWTGGNRPIVVGERGPEVFIPNRPGTVIPNYMLDYSAFEPWYRAAA